MEQIKKKWVQITLKDQSIMHAFVAENSKPSQSAIILLQEVFGVNQYIQNVCVRLAQEGYFVIAPELFHRHTPHRWECPYDQLSLGMQTYQKLTLQNQKDDYEATFQYLQSFQKIGCIGFCAGGRGAFIANSFLPFHATVCFYGGGIANTLDHASHQQGALLFFWGGKDGYISAADRRSVADTLHEHQKVFTEVNFDQADHGFFCDARASYHAPSATQAWALTKAFLLHHLS